MPSPWFDFIFDNAYQVDAKEAETKIRQKYPNLLHESEVIELAFTDRGGKGRDKEFFTSHRILIKDGKGIGSKRKNYKSIAYDSILAYAVQTAGLIDDDVEFCLWSSGIPYVSLNFATANVDLFQIYQFLNSKITWAKMKGTADFIDPVPPNMDKKQSKLGNMIDWLGDNATQIEVDEVERKFKTEYPILLADEKVELAFKSGRDTTFFTSNRIVIVDVKGIAGKQIEFKTVLYDSIHGFSVQTAGAFLDRDSEMTL